jgi:anti-sigma regulatory factor (Ser/Thr protein kinase)
MALMVRQMSWETGDLYAPTGTALLGHIAIAGRGDQVRVAREFVTRVLRRLESPPGREGTGPDGTCLDNAALLTSELVTNAIRHSASGAPGGTVAVGVRRLAGGIRVEVTDGGGADGGPVVKDDVYTCDGHGLFLVEALADDWGYERGDRAGMTVWFLLGA